MTLAERLTKKVELSLGGGKWRLIYTHAVLLDIEDLTGVDVLGGRLQFSNPQAHVVRAMTWTLLRRAGFLGTLKDLGVFLGPVTMGMVRQSLFRAWEACMPDPKPESESEDEEHAGEKAEYSWIEAWSTARVDLGLKDREWLDSTPRMIRALRERKKEQAQHQELMAGVVASTVANFSAHPPRNPLAAEDFMLHPYPKQHVEIDGEFLQNFFSKIKQ